MRLSVFGRMPESVPTMARAAELQACHDCARDVLRDYGRCQPATSDRIAGEQAQEAGAAHVVVDVAPREVGVVAGGQVGIGCAPSNPRARALGESMEDVIGARH